MMAGRGRGVKNGRDWRILLWTGVFSVSSTSVSCDDCWPGLIALLLI